MRKLVCRRLSKTLGIQNKESKTMGKQGGTKIYCSFCGEATVCKAIPLTELGYKSSQRWYRKDHDDINWFRRARECQECTHQFITAEIEENFITELVELRNVLGEIKLNAEKYAKKAEQATSSLDELSTSLNNLKALKIYKSA